MSVPVLVPASCARVARRLLAAVTVLAALAACAKIVGLEDSDAPATGGESKAGDGGGAGSATGAGSFPKNDAGAVISYQADITTKCGVANDDGYVAVQNTTDKPLNFKISSPTPGLVTLDDSDVPDASASAEVTGTVAPNQQQTVHLHVAAGAPSTGKGEVFVSTGNNLQSVSVTVTVTGGALSLSPGLVDFGQVRQDTAAAQQSVQVENTGNTDVNITGWTATAPTNDFAMAAGSINLKPGDTAQAAATFQTGGSSGPLTATFQPATTEPLCGNPPALALRGQRVSSTITVNPGVLGFGDFDCNSAPNAPQAITISNFTTGSVGFAVGQSNLFTMDPPSGAVPASPDGLTAATQMITVNPKPIGANVGDQSEALTVVLNGGDQRPVTATMTVRGAVLAIAPTTITGFSKNETRTYRVTNNGTDPVILDTESSDTTAFSVSNGSGTLGGVGDFFGNQADISVTMVRTSGGPVGADIVTRRGNGISIPPQRRLCNNPPVVHVSGTP